MMNEGSGHDANSEKRRANVVHWLVVLGLFPSKAAAGIATAAGGGVQEQAWSSITSSRVLTAVQKPDKEMEQTALMLFILPELVLSIANFASSYVTRAGVRTNFMRIV